jgi:hypothetical protein
MSQLDTRLQEYPRIETWRAARNGSAASGDIQAERTTREINRMKVRHRTSTKA